MNEHILQILLVILSYFIGCINGAYIFSTKVKKEDIRTYGSGNAGATNALRTYGFFSGLLVFLIDALKGVLAIGICKYFNMPSYIIMLSAIFVVLGHDYPVFMGFKGGKGVSTTIGILLMIDLKLGLVSIIIGVLVYLFTNMVSLGSLTALTLSPIIFILGKIDLYYIILSIFLGGIGIYKHRANIKRILNGTENKIYIKK